MSDSHTIALDVSTETHAFLKEAAGSGSLASFVRDAARSVAAGKLGREAPSETVKPRGKVNPLSAKAKEAGLPLDQYMRKVALETLGHTYTPPVKREKKIVPYVGDKPAEGGEVKAPEAEAPKAGAPKATPARPQAGLRRPAAR